MKAQSPQIGRYQVLKAYNEQGQPVAEVIFMQFDWTNFDFKVRKIRLQSLFNQTSEGPKEDYSVKELDKLNLHYLTITDMFDFPDPEKPYKHHYGLNWAITQPDNYLELIQEENEIASAEKW